MMKSLRYLCTLLLLTILGVWGGNSVFADTYEKYTGEITEGEYLICYNVYAMKAEVSSNRLVGAEGYNTNYGSFNIGDLGGAVIWKIQKDGDYYTLYNENAKKYAASTGTKNQAKLEENVSDKSRWTVSGTGTYEFVNKENAGKKINANLRNNGSYGFACYAIGTGGALTLYKKVESGSSLTPAGLAFVEDSYTATLGESFTAPTLTYAEGFNGTVTYASSNTKVATVNANTGAVTLVGAGTTTITASFAGNDTYAAGEASYTLTVVDPNAPGTENNPYTVAQALDADPVNGVYVTGIVSSVVSTSVNNGQIRYYISDDGTENGNKLNVYNGKGLNNEDFTSIEGLQVGDVVVIYGNLSVYQNVNQLAAGNYLISQTRKPVPTLSFREDAYSVVKNGSLTITATTNSAGTISYESSNTDVAEIDASTGVVTAKAAGTTTITATVAATDNYKAATATVELTVTAPKHKATFYQNGEKLSEAEFTEDATIEFPEATATIFGKQFVGWLPAEIEGTTNEASPIKAATMGTADVTYYAVYAYVEGEEKTSTLTNDDIKEYFTKEKPVYGTPKSYSDVINGVTWSASCNADAAGRPWIQIKKADDAYFKVNTEGNIANIKLTITSATNDKGGVTDITKHNAFSGTVYMEETASANPNGALGLSSDISNNSVTLVPTPSVNEVIIQVSAAARIWDAEVTYCSATYSDYCTTLTLAAPTFSVAAGEVEKGTEVTITAEEGATLKYTVGETTTTTESNTATVTVNEDVTIKAVAVKDGVESEEVSATYTVKAEEPVVLAAPIIFHDGGEYEGTLTVAMAGEGTIKYQLNDGAEQTYTAPVTISETTTVKAWTEQDGFKSDEVSKTFTINIVEKPAINLNGYYSIKGGDGKYVNVAGRKTVTFVDDNTEKAGTVIKVETENAQVKVLRSQGVDVPGYADKAMRYVPKIVQLVAEKLGAEGEGKLLGKDGLGKIMDKFNESFDYHLYLEKAGDGYRIYGRTPSMKPVVDFYAENKANVDAKLPQLEKFINDAIQKVLTKTNGSGSSILVPFKLETVWQNMDGTLTEPVDEASTARFYEEVLSSETNVWNFAYETAMIYWTKLKNHKKFEEYRDKLGEYAKYIDKVENIRPNFKYYIVQKGGEMDIISEGNGDIVANSENTIWTLEDRKEFSVAFNEENVLNNKYYTTLYTDFAYTLPEGVKAYKVTSIDASGCFGHAAIEEIGSQSIAAQTPVLLVSETSGNQTLALTETGTAVEGNWLVGPDYLINKYQIKTAQVESLFDIAKSVMGEDFYNNYVAEYEHLMLRTAGTVNNKYFFGLSKDDCKNLDENVCMLDNTEDAGLAFANGWETMGVNKAFLTSDIYTEIRLAQVGDVNRSGDVTIADVKALVEIVLGKATPENASEKYDFGATDVNCDGKTTIADVTALVNIILKKTQN